MKRKMFYKKEEAKGAFKTEWSKRWYIKKQNLCKEQNRVGTFMLAGIFSFVITFWGHLAFPIGVLLSLASICVAIILCLRIDRKWDMLIKEGMEKKKNETTWANRGFL